MLHGVLYTSAEIRMLNACITHRIV